jgi:hypothetical protein
MTVKYLACYLILNIALYLSEKDRGFAFLCDILQPDIHKSPTYIFLLTWTKLLVTTRLSIVNGLEVASMFILLAWGLAQYQEIMKQEV